MTIPVHNPNNLPLIDYRTVKPFQGDLKELSEEDYARLLNSLLLNGFFLPLFLWFKPEPPKKGSKQPATVTPYALDGHQRRIVMIGEDVTLDNGPETVALGEPDYRVPYLRIDAANEEEARKRLLVITSQYGKINEGGFRGFTSSLDPDFLLQTVSFDALNVADMVVPAVSFDPVEDETPVPYTPLHSPSIQRAPPIESPNRAADERKYDARGTEIPDAEKDNSPKLFPFSVLLEKPEQNKLKAFKERINTISDLIAFKELLKLTESNREDV